jgi:hypothetical protein
MSQVGVADRNEIGSFRKELQIEQTQYTRFGLLARFVMLELKGMDVGLRLAAASICSGSALSSRIRGRDSPSVALKWTAKTAPVVGRKVVIDCPCVEEALALFVDSLRQ